MTFDAKQADAVTALRELLLAGEKYRLNAAHYLGLTVSESQAVSYLLARGSMGQTDLAHALGFNSSSTTALIDRLEHKDYVERIADPDDRRRSTVQLSAAGLTKLQDVREWLEGAFTNIPRAALSGLTEHLHQMSEGLVSTASGIPHLATASRRRRVPQLQ